MVTASQWAQDSLLVADDGEFIIPPAHYVFRHFSRYVEPGARVVAVTGGDAVALKNPDDSLVVVLYNEGAVTPLTVAVGERDLRFSAPERGFATLVVPWPETARGGATGFLRSRAALSCGQSQECVDRPLLRPRWPGRTRRHCQGSAWQC